MNKKAIHATGWAFITECAAKLIVPITNMVLARILTPDAFGIIVTINMVISFADMITSAGFQKYLIQAEFKSKDHLFRTADVAFWTNLSISLSALLIITFCRDVIADFVGSEGYGLGIAVASISLPLTSLSSIYEGIYKRNLDFKVLFWVRIIVCMIPFVVTIPLALIGLDYWALIIGSLAGQVAKDLVYVLYKRTWWPSLYYSFSLLKKMLSFGIWTLFEAVISWLISWVDVFIVSNMMNAYYTGLYKTAQSTVSSTLSIITSATQPVLFSLLSRCKENKNELKNTFIQYIKYVAVVMIPLGVGIYAYADFVTLVLLGDQWIEASKFIGMWGLCSAMVCLFAEYNREAYRAIGKPQAGFIAQTLHLLFIIPVCWISVKKGFAFLTTARSVAYLEVVLIHAFVMKKVIGISFFHVVKETLIPFVSSFIMFLASIGLKKLLPNTLIGYVFQICICVILYFGALSCFKQYRVIERKYFESLQKKIKKQ